MKTDKKIIMVDGQSVEVTDEVYEVYTKGDRKMRYMEQDLKTEKHVHTKENDAETVIPSREDSLERLSANTAHIAPPARRFSPTLPHT